MAPAWCWISRCCRINRYNLDVQLGGNILGGGKSLAGVQGPKIIKYGLFSLGTKISHGSIVGRRLFKVGSHIGG